MSFLKMLISVLCLFLLSNPCFADDSMIAKEQMQQTLFNHNVLNMARDSSVLIHSLELLKSNNGVEIEKFMEYQIDEIVCAAGEMTNRMNPSQKKRTLKFLQSIKKYRAENPRKINQIDPTQFSEYFKSFKSTYAKRADEILANLKQ